MSFSPEEGRTQLSHEATIKTEVSFEVSSPIEEFFQEVDSYIGMIFCGFYLPSISQDTLLHSLGILKRNKGSFRSLP